MSASTRVGRGRVRLLAVAGAACAALLVPVVASADTWTIMSSPDTSTTQNNDLLGVTCVSAGDCYAVGYYTDATTGSDQVLIEHETGQTWSIVTGVPDPNTNSAWLWNATCVTATDCWAAGYYTPDATNPGLTEPLIEHYDGTSWTIDSSADTGIDSTVASYLDGVACTSASNCWAVGVEDTETTNTSASHGQNLIEHFDGTSWSIDTSSPDANSDRTNQLQNISCSGGSCYAVGFYYTPSASVATTIIPQNMVLQNTGTGWTLMGGVPDTSGDQPNYLNGISCTTATNCWADGEYTDSTADQTLAMHYDGTGWTIVTTPDLTGSGNAEIFNDLNSISCDPATGDCWAVGEAPTTGTAQTLIEEDTGAGWVLVSSPDSSTSNADNLYGVACPDAADCVAVGAATMNPGDSETSLDQTLIETNAAVLTSALPELPLVPLTTIAIAGSAVVWLGRRRITLGHV